METDVHASVTLTLARLNCTRFGTGVGVGVGVGVGTEVSHPFRSIVAPPLPLTTTKSGLPSRLKSPTVSVPDKLVPTPGDPADCENPALPSLARTVTVFNPILETARSRVPSRLKSVAIMKSGFVPAANGEPTAWVKPPLPFPNNIETFPLATLATAISGLPS